jgi:hypothetical protein
MTGSRYCQGCIRLFTTWDKVSFLYIFLVRTNRILMFHVALSCCWTRCIQLYSSVKPTLRKVGLFSFYIYPNLWQTCRSHSISEFLVWSFMTDSTHLYKYYVFGRYPSSCLDLKTSSCLFFKAQRFGDWILSPSSGKTYSSGSNR